ncbi:MAG: PIN domain-containing protein [Propionibacteriaceae bacterium]|jgi:toxin-antitoxin system PIN domain toxin|nr:PIN domain-containing protein [Propionibacteriaceae bacterium]
MTDLADTNFLLALHVPAHPFHAPAAEWFDTCESFATTPMTETGLVRLLTRADVMNGSPLPPAAALTLLGILKQQPHVAFWPDGEQFERSRFAYALQGPAQVTDLHLLDLAAARGGVLVTFDTRIAAALRPRDRRYLRQLSPR